jgi:hypothetical protein
MIRATPHIAFGLLFFFVPALANAAQYYVSPSGNDSAAGSQSAPFKTIQKGVNVAKAGDTVNVLPGTYNERVKTKTHGTAGARITYRSTEKWKAKIVGQWSSDGDYVRIEGFEITQNSTDSSGTDYGSSGIIHEGQHSHIVGNHVHHVTGTGINSAGWTSANPYRGVDNHIIGNLVHDTGNKRLIHGIYFAHPQGTIKNNIVYNWPDYGIHLWHNPRDIEISHNLVFNSVAGGIVVGAGDSPGNGLVQNVTVSNNIFINNGKGLTASGNVGPNNRFINNLVFGNGKNVDVSTSEGTVRGTITADPKFVNFAGGDYRLQAGSPAIDKGTTIAAIAYDIDRKTRPSGSGYDIGPYEYGASGGTTGTTGGRNS